MQTILETGKKSNRRDLVQWLRPKQFSAFRIFSRTKRVNAHPPIPSKASSRHTSGPVFPFSLIEIYTGKSNLNFLLISPLPFFLFLFNVRTEFISQLSTSYMRNVRPNVAKYTFLKNNFLRRSFSSIYSARMVERWVNSQTKPGRPKECSSRVADEK